MTKLVNIICSESHVPKIIVQSVLQILTETIKNEVVLKGHNVKLFPLGTFKPRPRKKNGSIPANPILFNTPRAKFAKKLKEAMEEVKEVETIETMT